MKSRTGIAAAMLLGLAVVVPFGACSGSTGRGGAAAGGASGNCGVGHATGGSSDLATFDTIRMIVQVQCGGPGCHNDMQSPHMTDDASLYTTLTTFVSPMCGNRVLVKPCAPDESAFYLAQRGQCGTLEKMPKGCVDLCTPDAYLEGIRQWIANGAPNQ